MAYTDENTLAQDVTFRARVKEAMITSAIAVQSESGTTTDHTNRSNYAKLVLNDPDSYVDRFAEAVVTNSAITGSSLDSDILFTVNSMFSALAGVI